MTYGEKLNAYGFRDKIDKSKWIQPNKNFNPFVGKATTNKQIP